jgi:hypothetical protein
MTQEVIFKISKDGQNIDVKAQGFHGSGCVETVKKFTKNLGEMGDSGKTPEFDLASQGGVRVGA